MDLCFNLTTAFTWDRRESWAWESIRKVLRSPKYIKELSNIKIINSIYLMNLIDSVLLEVLNDNIFDENLISGRSTEGLVLNKF